MTQCYLIFILRVFPRRTNGGTLFGSTSQCKSVTPRALLRLPTQLSILEQSALGRVEPFTRTQSEAGGAPLTPGAYPALRQLPAEWRPVGVYGPLSPCSRASLRIHASSRRRGGRPLLLPPSRALLPSSPAAHPPATRPHHPPPPPARHGRPVLFLFYPSSASTRAPHALRRPPPVCPLLPQSKRDGRVGLGLRGRALTRRPPLILSPPYPQTTLCPGPPTGWRATLRATARSLASRYREAIPPALATRTRGRYDTLPNCGRPSRGAPEADFVTQERARCARCRPAHAIRLRGPFPNGARSLESPLFMARADSCVRFWPLSPSTQTPKYTQHTSASWKPPATHHPPTTPHCCHRSVPRQAHCTPASPHFL